jgi:hypothetical protein
MPAGSPIGSGQGILNANNLRICMEYLKGDDPDYPVIVDAGVGTASDVAEAMELGVDGVLLNTAIAHATDPLRMAHAMKAACFAGRQAFLAGRMPRRLYATASSPDAQRRLMVVPGTDVGRPASKPAIRATSRLSSPAWLAHPRKISSSWDQSAEGFRSASTLTGTAARSSARVKARAPPNRPIGVRTASQM